MLWIAGIGLALIGLWLGARWFAAANPRDLIRVLKWGGGILALGLVVFLVLRGGAGLLAPLALFVLPAFRQWLRGRLGRWGSGPAAPGAAGQTSAVETATLRMTLDHDSGRIGGDIKQGPFAGRTLDGLGKAEVLDLWDWCATQDGDSVGLVEAYLDRAHPGWREQAETRREAAPPPSGAPMTRDEALAVLGLEPGASDGEIRAAYHRLMLKVHPDQGGSTFLAAKINQAKDLLLRA